MAMTALAPAASAPLDVTLPYAAACAGIEAAALTVRPLGGEDELLLDEALEAGANPAAAASLLIGRCLLRGGVPIGARARVLALGDREVALRAVYAATFGPSFVARVACGAGCGEAIEFDMDLRALVQPAPEAGPSHRIGGAPCRVPTGADVEEALARPGDPGAALAAICTGGAALDGALLARELARLDPNAECALDLECPHCGAMTQALLDGLDLIRNALSESGGIMAQIDRLARAYGWSEAEILALPRARRLRYCALAGAA